MKKTVYLIIFFITFALIGCGDNTNNSEKKYKMSLKGDPFKTYPETVKKIKNKIKENNKNLEEHDKKTQELFNI